MSETTTTKHICNYDTWNEDTCKYICGACQREGTDRLRDLFPVAKICHGPDCEGYSKKPVERAIAFDTTEEKESRTCAACGIGNHKRGVVVALLDDQIFLCPGCLDEIIHAAAIMHVTDPYAAKINQPKTNLGL